MATAGRAWQDHLRQQENVKGTAGYHSAFPKYRTIDNVDIIGHVSAMFCSHALFVLEQ